MTKRKTNWLIFWFLHIKTCQFNVVRNLEALREDFNGTHEIDITHLSNTPKRSNRAAFWLLPWKISGRLACFEIASRQTNLTLDRSWSLTPSLQENTVGVRVQLLELIAEMHGPCPRTLQKWPTGVNRVIPWLHASHHTFHNVGTALNKSQAC